MGAGSGVAPGRGLEMTSPRGVLRPSIGVHVVVRVPLAVPHRIAMRTAVVQRPLRSRVPRQDIHDAQRAFHDRRNGLADVDVFPVQMLRALPRLAQHLALDRGKLIRGVAISAVRGRSALALLRQALAQPPGGAEAVDAGADNQVLSMFRKRHPMFTPCSDSFWSGCRSLAGFSGFSPEFQPFSYQFVDFSGPINISV